jgi:hypothetical protein
MMKTLKALDGHRSWKVVVDVHTFRDPREIAALAVDIKASMARLLRRSTIAPYSWRNGWMTVASRYQGFMKRLEMFFVRTKMALLLKKTKQFKALNGVARFHPISEMHKR